ncbi:glycosyltransferase family 2 protein [Planctomycetota bacterium]
MTDISVIVVNWNTRDFVLECVRTMLKNQGDYSLEIIVVDNASEDDSVSSLKEQFPSVRLIENKQNHGFAHANNQGMEIAQGRYLCLVNSDIKFIEDCLGPMLAYMEQSQDVGVLGPKLLWKDETLQLSCRTFPSLRNTLFPAMGLTCLFPGSAFFSSEHMGYFAHDRTLQVDVLVGAFLMVRRQAYEQVGGMDESYFMYCEEVDWCKRMVNAKWKIVFFSDAKVIHYGGGSSCKEPQRFLREYYLSNLQYWKKYHPGLKNGLYHLILIVRLLFRISIWSVLCVCLFPKRQHYKEKIKLALSGLSPVLGRQQCSSRPE